MVVEKWVGGIDSYVRRERANIIAFLCEYISQVSVNPKRVVSETTFGGEAAAQEWLLQKLSHLGFDDTRTWARDAARPNVCWVLGAEQSKIGMTFNGHADTVDVSSEQADAWHDEESPWCGLVRGGRVYGRGAADMKGGIAAFLWAGKAILDLGIPLRRAVAFTVTVGEEATESEIGIGSVAGEGLGGGLWIVAEPTDLAVCNRGVGLLYFQIRVSGKSGHICLRRKSVQELSAYEDGLCDVPPMSVSAAGLALKVVDEIVKFERRWVNSAEAVPACRSNREVSGSRRGIGLIHIRGGGEVAETMGECVLEFGATMDPGDSADELLVSIQAVIAQCSKESRWMVDREPELRSPILHSAIEPFRTDLDENTLSGLLRVGGGEGVGDLQCMPGPCDANILSAAGERVVVWGPGRLDDGAHGANESIAIDDVMAAVNRFANAIVELCGARER